MAHKTFTGKDVTRLLATQYGFTDTARHYLRLAKEAGDRFNINLQAEKNTVALAEASEMRRHLETLTAMLLGDDSKKLDETDK